MTDEVKWASFKNNNVIGLIVRGKYNHGHDPIYLAQHADCILSNGTPVGFFGDSEPYTGGSASAFSPRNFGMNMRGYVLLGVEEFEHSMNGPRPAYVDMDLAEKKGVISTVLLLQVPKEMAAKFDEYWKKLRKDPGMFNIAGGNCSTHAAEAFAYAGLIPNSEISGIDNPNQLYYDILKTLPINPPDLRSRVEDYFSCIHIEDAELSKVYDLCNSSSYPVKKHILSGYVGFRKATDYNGCIFTIKLLK